MIGRVLSSTEQQFYNYCMDERQAVAFAKLVTLPENASYEYIENVVAMLLVKVKEAADGPSRVEYVCGHRRDIWRRQ